MAGIIVPVTSGAATSSALASSAIGDSVFTAAAATALVSARAPIIRGGTIQLPAEAAVSVSAFSVIERVLPLPAESAVVAEPAEAIVRYGQAANASAPSVFASGGANAYPAAASASIRAWGVPVIVPVLAQYARCYDQSVVARSFPDAVAQAIRIAVVRESIVDDAIVREDMTRYVCLADQYGDNFYLEIEVRVYDILSNKNLYRILANDPYLLVQSLDGGCSVKRKIVWPGTAHEHAADVLTFSGRGGAEVAAYYRKGQEWDASIDFRISEEVVGYERFIANTYRALLSPYDQGELQMNPALAVMLDNCAEFMDMLWDYSGDAADGSDPRFAKRKFLNAIGADLGLERDDWHDEGTPAELKSDALYRELLSNLRDVLEIRGTAASYELFFGALGYDVDLEEYWFDANGALIEVRPFGGGDSTFFAYSRTGAQLDDFQIAHMDPRGSAGTAARADASDKSCYVRPVLTPREGFSGDAFSPRQRVIVNKYLAMLKPMHVRYLEETFGVAVENQYPNPAPPPETLGEADRMFAVPGGPAHWLDDDHEQKAELMMMPYPAPWYSPPSGLDRQLPYFYGFGRVGAGGYALPPDPGRIGGAEFPEHSTWAYSGGGAWVEHVFAAAEAVSVSAPVLLADVLQTIVRYDRKGDPLHYDVVGSLFYDIGVFLEETSAIVNVAEFMAAFTAKTNAGEPQPQVLAELSSQFGISESQCLALSVA